jgi:hypothetical protein
MKGRKLPAAGHFQYFKYLRYLMLNHTCIKLKNDSVHSRPPTAGRALGALNFCPSLPSSSPSCAMTSNDAPTAGVDLSLVVEFSYVLPPSHSKTPAQHETRRLLLFCSGAMHTHLLMSGPLFSFLFFSFLFFALSPLVSLPAPSCTLLYPPCLSFNPPATPHTGTVRIQLHEPGHHYTWAFVVH